MNTGTFITFCITALVAFSSATAASPDPAARVIPLCSFEGDDISVVLRALARQGNIQLSIASKLTGSVTLRVENKTPREIIDMIATTKHLVVNERDGILYVRPPARGCRSRSRRSSRNS